MIRREVFARNTQKPSGWILISQVEHAHLAAHLAEVWGNQRVSGLPLPELLLPAIRDHDEGWRDWEREPDLHPDSLLPRNFTEMSPEEATRIWRHSIETCRRGRQSIVPTIEEFRWFLSLSGMRLTHERAIIAEEVFSSREAFSTEELLSRLPVRDDGRRVARASVYRTLALMEEARLLRKVSMGTYRDAYEQTRKIGAGSVWGGVWVSQHFCYLAERASNHDPEQSGVWEQFLKEQHQLQKQWTQEIVREWGRMDAASLILLGFHWVQFFDLLSLWLCCRERTETEPLTAPGGETLYFTPLKSGEIAVEPYPFSVPSLELVVDGRRVPQNTFSNRAEFLVAFDRARRERLVWKFVQW